MAANWDSDEWEVVNDDGFVYKRKKRRMDPTSFARAPDPEPNLNLAIKEKRRRKRAALLKIKEKYQTEIILWENLSNTLKTMEESVSEQVKEKQTEEREGEKLQRSANKGFESFVSIANSSGSLVDELLLQVEAQEAITRSFEQLCDVADSCVMPKRKRIINVSLICQFGIRLVNLWHPCVMIENCLVFGVLVVIVVYGLTKC